MRRQAEYAREQPADGEGLVGWRVCAYFPKGGETPWFDGVVVAYSGVTGEHLVFYECDDGRIASTCTVIICIDITGTSRYIM